MTPDPVLTAQVDAALAALERQARIERNLDTYRRGLKSWLAKVDQALAAQQKTEN